MNLPHVPKHRKSGIVLATIGVLTVLSEVVARIAASFTGRTFELDHWVLVAGAVMGFVGFYMVDSKKTTAGIGVISDFIPRFGRRATDPVAIPSVETKITATHAVPPIVDDTHDGGKK